jgi:hypothetical protein
MLREVLTSGLGFGPDVVGHFEVVAPCSFPVWVAEVEVLCCLLDFGWLGDGEGGTYTGIAALSCILAAFKTTGLEVSAGMVLVDVCRWSGES